LQIFAAAIILPNIVKIGQHLIK